jgi:hypothetical protein
MSGGPRRTTGRPDGRAAPVAQGARSRSPTAWRASGRTSRASGTPRATATSCPSTSSLVRRVWSGGNAPSQLPTSGGYPRMTARIWRAVAPFAWAFAYAPPTRWPRRGRASPRSGIQPRTAGSPPSRSSQDPLAWSGGVAGVSRRTSGAHPSPTERCADRAALSARGVGRPRSTALRPCTRRPHASGTRRATAR